MTMAILAALPLMILTGCETTRLKDASAEQGRLAAGVNLPDWPAECRKEYAHISPQEGDKWRHIQLRWEDLNYERNLVTNRCARYYDQLQEEYGNVK